jgi:hypothetical protein
MVLEQRFTAQIDGSKNCLKDNRDYGQVTKTQHDLILGHSTSHFRSTKSALD